MQEQLLCVYICSNQWICRIYKGVKQVLLNDFRPRGQSADAEPGSVCTTTQSKCSDLEPLPNTQPRPQKWIQSLLQR